MVNYELNNHVKLHVIETKKYKNTTISVRLLLPLEEDKASSRSLLAMMMPNRTKNYPTVNALTQYLDSNYGMGLTMNTFSIGSGHLFDIQCNAIDPFYLEGESLLTKQVEMLQEVLWNPLVDENGFFDEDLWQEAKMILKSKIIRRMDDPSSFAIDLNNKLVGKGNTFAISALGNEEDVDAITKESTKQAYLDLLSLSKVDVFVIGDVCSEEVYTLLSKYSFSNKKEPTPVDILYSWNEREMIEHEEEREIDQSIVILTWYTGIDFSDPLYYALKLGNIILGGDSNSLMFKKIREENSYCYSVFSSIYSMDKILIGYAGISYENKEATVSLMKEMMTRVQEGAFTDQLETAKLIYINSLRSQCDTKSGLLNFVYQQDLVAASNTLENVIEKIQSVDKEQVMQAMRSCELIGEFVLKEKSHE
ncbi:MAG: insulinase family protein [Erysipelotrichales bacterium]|nr:insulinase family protein [Erysipelotrichales bacterium]